MTDNSHNMLKRLPLSGKLKYNNRIRLELSFLQHQTRRYQNDQNQAKLLSANKDKEKQAPVDK